MLSDFSSESFLVSTEISSCVPSFDMKLDFFDALSEGDVERASQVFSISGVLLFPGVRPMVGRPLVQRMMGIIRRRYDDILWRPIGPVVGSGGWVVTSWSVSGTFKQSRGRYTNEVLSLARIDAAGKIAVLSDYFKDTTAFTPLARTADPKLDCAVL